MEPSITLEHTTTGSLEERMDAVLAAGFQAVNIGTPDCKHFLCSDPQEIKELHAQLQERGLSVDWVHAPYQVPVL